MSTSEAEPTTTPAEPTIPGRDAPTVDDTPAGDPPRNTRGAYGRVTGRLPDAGDAALAERLREVLDGGWPEARAAVRDAMTPEMLTPQGLTMEQHRDHVLEQLRVLSRSGVPQLGFRVEDGGTGDAGGALTSFEMLGHLDLSLMVKAGVQWGLFGGAVSNLGSAEVRRTYLPDTMSLDLLGCFAMTEMGQGSDVQNLETTATYDRDTREFVVHTPTIDATKAYIGGAGRDARLAAVFAQLITHDDAGEELRHGVHCLLVPIRDESGADLPGVTTEDHRDKGGLLGVDNGRITFDHVRVPREALLDRFGQVSEDGQYSSPIESVGARFFTMLGTLIRGRVSVGAASGAAARTALAIAVRYSLIRRQFEHPETGRAVPLLEYRQHQRRLLPRVAKAYVYAVAQNAIITELDTFEKDPEAFDDHRRREMEAHAAGIKSTVTAFANDTISECRLACGGAGYMEENRLTRTRADADVFSTFEGDNTVLMQLVAKEQLTAYSHEFGSMDQRETVQFALGMVADVIQEKVRAATLWQRLVDSVTDREETDLRDRANQLELLMDREEHLIETAAQRLRRAEGDDGSRAFQVFNSAQDHVLECGRAHMDRWVFEQFAEAIEQVEDPAAREVLDLIAEVYVLDIVDREKGWFLEHGRLTTERTKMATKTLNRACTKLAGRARTLVDAFAIPEFVLDVPMLSGAGVDRDTEATERGATGRV